MGLFLESNMGIACHELFNDAANLAKDILSFPARSKDSQDDRLLLLQNITLGITTTLAPISYGSSPVICAAAGLGSIALMETMVARDRKIPLFPSLERK